MKSEFSEEFSIFEIARQLQPEIRDQYLEQVCRSSKLKERVLSLLESADDDGFLEKPIEGGRDVYEKVGDTVGPYKLLEEIGSGGMGIVFMAEQRKSVRRTVALKIIKPGMDTCQVVNRFAAEKQALATMDHPNIAKIFDAGVTDFGRPYFAMELVRGPQITDYCDDRRMPLPDRLRLFRQVCSGIQHAHQKGVIHRDIKPPNILIGQYDGIAVPKIIDFGIAKAVTQPLTERTVFTRFGQLIGTPEYMSPEQAQLNQLDIDTRSDVYSLGVLLYEILTGTTPINKQNLDRAAFEEILRIVREQEAPRPSIQLSDSETLELVAESRRIEPARLSSELKGDLDWIVLKAIDKERKRRYETADSLGRDIDRYLSGDPVDACPPTMAYRLRKYVLKNSRWLSVTGVILMILVASTAVSTWQWRLAVAAQEDAEDSRKDAEDAARVANDAKEQETRERLRAEKLTRYNLAQRLSVSALDVFSDYPQRSLLLAAEANDLCIRRGFTPSAFALETIRTLLKASASIRYRYQFSANRKWAVRMHVIDSPQPGIPPMHMELLQRDGDRFHVVEQCFTHYRTKVVFSTDGRWAAANVERDLIRVWDLRKGAKRDLRQRLPNQFEIGFPKASNRLAITTYPGQTMLFDLLASHIEADWILPGGSMSPDRQWLVTAVKGKVECYDLTSVDPAVVIDSIRHDIGTNFGESLFATNEKLLTFADNNVGQITISAGGGMSRSRMQFHEFSVEPSYSFSRKEKHNVLTDDGPGLVICAQQFGRSNQLAVLNLKTQGLKRLDMPVSIDDKALTNEIQYHENIPPTSFSLSPYSISENSRWLGIAGTDDRIRIWDLGESDLRDPKFVTVPLAGLYSFQMTDTHVLAWTRPNSHTHEASETLIWAIGDELSRPKRFSASKHGYPVFVNRNELMLNGMLAKYGHESLPKKRVSSAGSRILLDITNSWMVYSTGRQQKVKFLDSHDEVHMPWSEFDKHSTHLSPNQRYVADVLPSGEVRLIDFEQDDPIQSSRAIGATTSEDSRIYFSPSNDLLLQSQHELTIWRSPDFVPQSVILPADNILRSIADFDGSRLIMHVYPELNSRERSYEVWDIKRESEKSLAATIVRLHDESNASALKLLGGGRWMVEQTDRGALRLYDFSKTISTAPYATIDLDIEKYAVLGDGTRLVARSKNGTLIYIDMQQPQNHQLVMSSGGRIDTFTVSKRGDVLAGADSSGKIFQLNLNDVPFRERIVCELREPIHSISLSSNAAYLAVYSGDSNLRCFDLHDRTSPKPNLHYASPVPFGSRSSPKYFTPVFDRRNQRISAHGRESNSSFTLVWDITAPKPEVTLRKFTDRSGQPIFSRDYKTVYSITYANGLSVISPKDPALLVTQAQSLAGRSLRQDERQDYMVLQDDLPFTDDRHSEMSTK